ncbi:uncharacterized protein LOC107774044 isoform X3 [Nicotiana tabacum]|uniref:Uncharacterized protein LOC107774044 isoform X3 n=2 Tax=Nicotiana tabacum TaxID=4097 RepID=A0A1S3YA62_TOBAC|nr:PREDICTED: uncharacterized protein LOC107774044 isoform X3 [Nicotiana tabacum]
MALRGNINQITPDTPDWTCKVQIVEIGRERETEKKFRYQNLILEDEEEQQIRGVVWGDDIQYYADKLKLFHTYLISTARVKISSTQYGRPLHKFYWVLDKETIVELVEKNGEREIPKPPPRKPNLTDFDHIAHITPDPATEIDILAVVVHCGPPKYAGRVPNRCREIIVTDNQAKENNDMLGGCASDNFSRSPRSSTSLMVIPTQQQIIPIAEIQSQTSVKVLCA